jgi:hypothetical protein
MFFFEFLNLVTVVKKTEIPKEVVRTKLAEPGRDPHEEFTNEKSLWKIWHIYRD